MTERGKATSPTLIGIIFWRNNLTIFLATFGQGLGKSKLHEKENNAASLEHQRLTERYISDIISNKILRKFVVKFVGQQTAKANEN